MVRDAIKFGIEPLDFALPEGVPRKSAIVISGGAGTGKSVLLANIANSFLSRGESVVYVNFDDSYHAILDLFRDFNWPIDEYVSKDLFFIIDGFYHRLRKWVREAETPMVVEVASLDPERLLYAITSTLDAKNVRNRGLVIIDSLNELALNLNVQQVLLFIKMFRGAVAKFRGVMSIMSLHTTTAVFKELQAHLEYLVDGIIDTRIDPELQQLGIPLKQLMVKKMRGAPTNSLWVPYVIAEDGIRPVDQQKLSALIRARLKESLQLPGRVE